MVFNSEVLTGMPLPENALSKIVVCDLELWTHDLKNVISVIWTGTQIPRHCVKIYPKICHKIILRQKLWSGLERGCKKIGFSIFFKKPQKSKF